MPLPQSPHTNNHYVYHQKPPLSFAYKFINYPLSLPSEHKYDNIHRHALFYIFHFSR